MIYEGISGSASHRNLPYICLVVIDIKLNLPGKLLEEYTVELLCLTVVAFTAFFMRAISLQFSSSSASSSLASPPSLLKTATTPATDGLLCLTQIRRNTVYVTIAANGNFF